MWMESMTKGWVLLDYDLIGATLIRQNTKVSQSTYSIIKDALHIVELLSLKNSLMMKHHFVLYGNCGVVETVEDRTELKQCNIHNVIH